MSAGVVNWINKRSDSYWGFPLSPNYIYVFGWANQKKYI